MTQEFAYISALDSNISIAITVYSILIID